MAKKLGTLKAKRLFLGTDSGGRGTEVTSSAAELNQLGAGAVTADVTGGIVTSTTLQTTTGTPVDAVAAVGTITLTDGITQSETLVIGADTYEFDIDAAGVTAGNIAVPLVTGSVTKEDGAASLETVAGTSGTADVGVVDNDDGTLTVTSATKGVIGNAIAFSEDGAHIAVDQLTSTDFLGGTTAGVDGTVGLKGEIRWDGDFIYICINVATTADTGKWLKAALSAL